MIKIKGKNRLVQMYFFSLCLYSSLVTPYEHSIDVFSPTIEVRYSSYRTQLGIPSTPNIHDTFTEDSIPFYSTIYLHNASPNLKVTFINTILIYIYIRVCLILFFSIFFGSPHFFQIFWS